MQSCHAFLCMFSTMCIAVFVRKLLKNKKKMPKHRRDDPFRSFIESHVDSEKDEELKRAKTEIEGNVQKILEAVGDDNNDGKEQVVNLIEDFHKHYQLLYESYDHLSEELRKKADGNHGKDSSSSDKVGIDDLKRKLAITTDAKEKLHQEHQAALNETHEAHNTTTDLSSEAEKWNDEKSRLLTENAAFKTELAENKIQDLVTESRQLRSILAEKGTKEKLESAAKEIPKLSEMQKAAEDEKVNLSLKIKQAENRIQDLDTESRQLREKLDEKENEISSHKEQASTDVRDLELELDSSHSQRRDVVKQKDDQISALLKQLEDQKHESEKQLKDKRMEVETSQKQIELLQSEKRQMETQMETLREEKREAIRQLCSDIEYYRVYSKELQGKLKRR